jgi:dethiobiotin synthetase
VIDVFLTGTAPGVGKTRVAGLYARDAIARGRTPGFLKPAQTGRSDDALAVAATAPGTVCATGYRYLAPLSPGVAARLEHAAPASIDHLLEVVEELRETTDGVIVEGGGLLESLGETTTFADLAAAIGLPLVIVTRPDIAALSVVALMVEAAAARGLEVAGLAINDCAHKPDLVERTTRAELARIAPVLGSLPLETAIR